MRTKYLSPTNLFAIACLSVLSARGYSQDAKEPLKTVVPVTINPVTDSITVGTAEYAGTNPGVNLIALKRQPNSEQLDTPVLLGHEVFTDAADVNDFLQRILSNSETADAVLILNAAGNYGFALNDIAKNLEKFGSASDIEGVGDPIDFVFVGNGGLHSAGAHQSGYDSRTMSGYLARDSNGNYTFIQTDYVKYDLLVNGTGTGGDGTINIGANSYTVAGSGKLATCTDSNGFHVVAVDREVPANVIGNESYCTAQADSEITHLIADLKKLVGDESKLVCIASFGHPIPSNWNFGTIGDGRIYPLAQLIAQFGGYFETGVYLTPNDTFSLVGATAPPAGTPGGAKRGREASSVYPSHPSGGLHGVLVRGLRGNWYRPLNADYTGVANFGLYEALGSPSSFPHPANADELTAFQYIAAQLCPTCQNFNPRNDYPDTNIDIDIYLITLELMTDPNGGGACPAGTQQTTPFCIMRQQLLTEFAYVSDIRDFNQNLQTVWAGAGTLTITNLLSAYNTIQPTLNPPPAATAPSVVDPIVSFFLSLASLIPIPRVSAVFGAADAAFSLGTSLATDLQGNPTSTQQNLPIAQLEQQAGENFTAELATLGTQFNLIYQNWGRISSLGASLAGATPGSGLYWDGDTTTAEILNAMNPAILQSYYRTLMPLAYAIGRYVPYAWGQTPLWQQPPTYVVYDPDLPCISTGCAGVAQPFNFPWYVPYTFPTDATNPYSALGNGTNTIFADESWLGISNINTPSNGGSNGLYQPPSSTILSYLFTPLSWDDSGNLVGLGVYLPDFFETWPFPRVTCDVAWFEGDPGQGCPWGSAKQPN